MRKHLPFLLPLIPVLLIILFTAPSVFAQSAQSNCAVVKVGSPAFASPDCSSQINPTSPGYTPPPSNSVGEAVVNLARTQMGRDYLLGACHSTYKSSPPPAGCSKYDCSGFAGWAWYWASDKKVDLRGQSTRMMWGDSTGRYQKFSHTQLNQLQPGDLVMFAYNRSVSQIHHVGVYTGTGSCGRSDCFIESTTRKGGTVIDDDSVSRREAARKDVIGFLRPVVK